MPRSRLPADLLWRCSPDRFAERLTQHQAGAQRFQRFAHIVLLSRIIVAAIARGRGRVIINMPPQHGKSQLLSKFVPAWYLEHQPAGRVIASSYSEQLVRANSRFVRDTLLTHPACQTRLIPDSKAANRWNTDQGGGMYAAPVGGQISGFSGDLMLIDDPHKGWQEAWSPAKRKRVIEWFQSDFYTRRQQNTTMIVLQTRWHPMDLTGYLIKQHPDDWQVVSLPALAIANDPLGRPVGAPLCPELHDTESLAGSRSSSAIWDALYQQDPKGLGDDRCYHHFGDRNIDDSLKLVPGLPIQLSFDINLRPGMHVEIGQHLQDRDLVTVVDEIHERGMDVRASMEAFAAWWQRHDGAHRFGGVEVFGDTSGRTRSYTASESSYDLIRAKLTALGIAVRMRVPKHAPGVRNSVDDYNEALRDLNGDIHYLVHPRCTRLITDLSEVGTDEHGYPDKSDMLLTHASDAERYRVTRIRPISRRVIAAQPHRVSV